MPFSRQTALSAASLRLLDCRRPIEGRKTGDRASRWRAPHRRGHAVLQDRPSGDGRAGRPRCRPALVRRERPADARLHLRRSGGGTQGRPHLLHLQARHSRVAPGDRALSHRPLRQEGSGGARHHHLLRHERHHVHGPGADRARRQFHHSLAGLAQHQRCRHRARRRGARRDARAHRSRRLGGSTSTG